MAKISWQCSSAALAGKSLLGKHKHRTSQSLVQLLKEAPISVVYL